MKTDIHVQTTSTTSEPVLAKEDTAPEPTRVSYPARFQRFDPKGPYNHMLYSRAVIDAVTNRLKAGERWSDKTKAKWSPKPLSMGATVDTKKLSDLLVAEHCSAKSLVVYLPPELEPFIAEMVSHQPRVMNCATTDLLHNQTYLSFSAGEGEFVASLWILDEEVYRDSGRCGGANGEDEFFAVVLVAGNSVAIGGYACDQDYADQCQCCSMSSQSFVPYSQEQLAQAALEEAKVGNWPTAYQLHYFDEVGITLTAPPIYRRQRKRGW